MTPTPREFDPAQEPSESQAAAIAQVRSLLEDVAVWELSIWLEEDLEELEQRFRSYWTVHSLQLRKGR